MLYIIHNMCVISSILYVLLDCFYRSETAINISKTYAKTSLHHANSEAIACARAGVTFLLLLGLGGGVATVSGGSARFGPEGWREGGAKRAARRSSDGTGGADPFIWSNRSVAGGLWSWPTNP